MSYELAAKVYENIRSEGILHTLRYIRDGVNQSANFSGNPKLEWDHLVTKLDNIIDDTEDFLLDTPDTYETDPSEDLQERVHEIDTFTETMYNHGENTIALFEYRDKGDLFGDDVVGYKVLAWSENGSYALMQDHNGNEQWRHIPELFNTCKVVDWCFDASTYCEECDGETQNV